ncbi:MAG: PQQ-binding-like beta-propeller repeat protein [Alphaproteobacteria bacterium]|jgi:outer membrane protein assembly factor BamB|nr:PQQ-binding-like beta-propeller repeat protein [Alphaproteobacteria bacterium]MBT4086416.1 PQQ-binding-like beta-propeller repeat protein [Alphaproteobacteria bacterium]MBT4546396.1 PQQ-binding-like beta-propeller repeat protein [Alphaproteobacteria bacterium]MBT7748039.1 PQQ-binding-like beta-propeller repeat protein [Alphaproteobacteria bacterium]
MNAVLRRAVAFLSLTALLTACDVPDWLGDAPAPPLPGERISIMSLQTTLRADPALADLNVRLPRPYVNGEWPQSGGHATHTMHHLEAADGLRRVWGSAIGSGSDDVERLTATPIYAAGQVFALDARSNVSAYDGGTGERYWRYNLTPTSEERGALGGGLGFDNGVLYVTTGYGDVIAMEPDTGAIIWTRSIGSPLRGAPTIDQGRVYVVSIDNKLHALDAGDGSIVWQHVGIVESAGLIGSASPAVQGDLVIVAYSSGELFALRRSNGRVAWVDSLSGRGRRTALAQLGDITGSPVIDRGRVYAVSHGGRMVAIDLRTGVRIWDQAIASVQTPWVAGDFVFVTTVESQVLALSRNDGRVRWVRKLARHVDEDRQELVNWTGPVLVGDRLITVSSQGVALAISPYTGEVNGQLELSDPVSMSPIVANQTLYFLTDEAELLAYR